MPDIQLDRTASHTGERHMVGYTNHPGEYPGLDQYGRVVRQMWVDGGFTTHASDPTVPKLPPILELSYDYDNASSRLNAYDDRPGAQQPLSHVYEYDGLRRLTVANRGTWDGANFTVGSTSRDWRLDALGNWIDITEDH